MSVKIAWPDNGKRPEYVDRYVNGLLERIAENAGLAELIVTSGHRDAARQAEAMYQNLKADKPAKGGTAQQAVSKVYDKMKGKDERAIVDAMKAKIDEIGAANVSKHCGNTQYLVTLDISFNRMPAKNRNRFADAVRAASFHGMFISGFRHPLETQGKESFDPCFHLEIPTYFATTGADSNGRLNL